MPEGIEIEFYRRAAEAVVGRTVAGFAHPDDWYLKGATTAEDLATLVGEVVTGTRRKGKLLLLDCGDATLGLRFGMTGRLLVDGSAPIERLEYSSARDDPAWDRFAIRFVGGGTLVIRDPRRLGGVEYAPDERRLGPDVFSLTPAELGRALRGGTGPLKARLLDQTRVAGLGNLCVDEILWRAGLHPISVAGAVVGTDARRLHRCLRSTLDDLLRRGGSHTGDLQTHRRPGGRCPRDGQVLERLTIGGRTTYACGHQRVIEPTRRTGPRRDG